MTPALPILIGGTLLTAALGLLAFLDGQFIPVFTAWLLFACGLGAYGFWRRWGRGFPPGPPRDGVHAIRYFPAPRLIVIAALIAVASSSLLFFPALLPWLGVAWLVLIALAVFDGSRARHIARRVEATLEVPASAVRDDELDVRMSIRSGVEHGIRLTVRPVLPDHGEPSIATFDAVLEPFQGRDYTLQVRAPERGAYAFEGLYLRTRGPLQLMESQFRRNGTSLCKVYPDIRQVHQYIATRRLHDTVAPHLRTARIRGLGSEFESMREYEEGDDIRRIDWKVTARHSRPIVRNYEIEPYRNVLILVDCGRLMTGGIGKATKLDHALDAALMIAGVALDGGDRCGILLYDQSVRAWLPPRSGLGQLRSIVDQVYDAQPVYLESNFYRPFVHMQTKLTKRSLVIILSDVVDAEASAALMTGMVSLSKRHLVVFTAIRTPEIEGVIETPTADPRDPFRKAVAYRLLDERTQVMARMQKAGVHVLDVRPEQLTVPLVNKYIELREMNLL